MAKGKLEEVYKIYTGGAQICTDTRKIEPGSVFFALKGPSFNGNEFASDAVKKGAVLCVLDEDDAAVKEENKIIVTDVLTFLQELARHHRKKLKIPVISITGSNGKTTTKELVNRVLSEKFTTLCTSGNLNNHIGVPLTILSVRKEHEIAIIEMGANHLREIALLCSIAQPDHVLITNIGKAHLEGFGGIEGVRKGKGEMYDWARENSSLVFLHEDDDELREMLGTYKHTVTYGHSEDADYSGSISEGGHYLSVNWHRYGRSLSIDTQLTGDYNFPNIMAAIAVGSHFGISDEMIAGAISSYEPSNQRSQVLRYSNNKTIVLDAYNANPTSMEASLRNFASRYNDPKAVILGEMLELGSESKNEHQRIAVLASSFGFNRVILAGKEFKQFCRADQHYAADAEEALRIIKTFGWSGYSILIKGSRGMSMEKVLEGLK